MWCKSGPSPQGARGAGEIERAQPMSGADRRADDLDDVGIVRSSCSRVIGGASVAMSTAGSASGARTARDGCRVDGRHVALQVDHHVVRPVRVELRQRLEDAVGAGGVIGAGQHRRAAGRGDRLDDRGIAGRPPRPARCPASTARRQTWTIIGSPWMSASGLPGRRVAPMRAGMRTMGLAIRFD